MTYSRLRSAYHRVPTDTNPDHRPAGVKFFLDRGVNAAVADALRRHGHQATELREVLPLHAREPALFAASYVDGHAIAVELHKRGRAECAHDRGEVRAKEFFELSVRDVPSRDEQQLRRFLVQDKRVHEIRILGD